MTKKIIIQILFFLLTYTFFGEEIRITSAGDMIPHLGLQQYCIKTRDFDSLFNNAAAELKKSVLSFVNFESSINTRIPVSGYPRFNAHPGFIKALKNAGFTHLSLANNHSLDMGAEGLRQTVNFTRQMGLQYSGISLTNNDYLKPLYFRAKGIRFSYLALTTITNGLNNPSGNNTPKVFIINRNNVTRILKLVADMRKNSDIVVISIHFGTEYTDMPDASQKYYARILARSGADIILGNHPHHIQRAEWLDNGRAQKTFVSYSQGNFISHQNRFIHIGNVNSPIAKRGDSYLLHIYIKKDSSGVAISRVSYTPTWTLVLKNNGEFSYSVILLHQEIKSQRYLGQLQIFIQRRKRIIDFLGVSMKLEEN